MDAEENNGCVLFAFLRLENSHMQGNSDFGPHKKRRTIQDYQKDAFSTRVTGILSLARSGVGFVTPENGGADILVPERDVGAALPGDTVEVQMLPPERPGGRPLGRVLSVLSRATQDFVCTLHREGRYWTAVPILACGNRTFNIKKPGTARDGDRVIVRFSAWDNPHLNPDAEPDTDEYDTYMSYLGDCFETEVYYALQNMEAGEIYEKPLLSFAGYFIIRLDRVKLESGFTPLEEVRDEIETKLRNERISEMFEAHLNNLTENHEVQYLFDIPVS